MEGGEENEGEERKEGMEFMRSLRHWIDAQSSVWNLGSSPCSVWGTSQTPQTLKAWKWIHRLINFFHVSFLHVYLVYDFNTTNNNNNKF